MLNVSSDTLPPRGTASCACPAVVEKNLAGIVETVEAVAPDIAVLQEVDVSGKRSYDIDERAALHASFGGAAAFAFNLNTLRRSQVVQHMQEAGLEVVSRPPYNDFSHWVEQAVDRDVVIGRKA